MRLNGDQRKQLCDALLDAFSSYSKLEQTVSFGMNENLEKIAGRGEDLTQVVFKLVRWAESNGRLEEFIRKAHKDRPGNEELKKLIIELEENEIPLDPQLRIDYLGYLQKKYQYFDMRGVPRVQQITHQLALKDIYVPLKTYPSAHQRVARRELRQETGVGGKELSEETVTSTQRVLVEQATTKYPAVVVLGHPGSGKSTLLKILTLAPITQSESPLPIIVPLNAYARRLQENENVSLIEYFAEYYAARQKKLADIGKLFNIALHRQKALILLDGLDEVQTNRAFLVDRIQDFVAEYIPQAEVVNENELTPEESSVIGNRIVVTSRIFGYNDAPLPARRWQTYYLTDFERVEIEECVHKWTLAFTYTAKGKTEPARQEADKERDDILKAIFSRPGVEKLAANPLLLTILVLVKYHGVALPNERVKLYELYLETLIETWNRSRSLDKYSDRPELDYGDTVRVLASMALWLRETNPSAGLINRHELEKWFAKYLRKEENYTPAEARRQAHRFLDEIGEATGLLVERGEKQYGFLHLTLEEMLAAQGIVYVMDEDYAAGFEFFRRYLLDPNWRETLQLAIGFTGVIRRNRTLTGSILQQLLQLELPPKHIYRQATFAAETLLDMSTTKVSPAIVQEIIAALVNAIECADCPILTRHEAGNLLGRLGDPRQGIAALPPLLTESIGSERKIKPFKAGIYPVTNTQFAKFIEDKAYETQDFWSEDGWLWRQEQNRKWPDYWEDKNFNSPNHPVVGVTWYEAEAFCFWLSAQYKGKYRLPTESEWKFLAQGQKEYEYPWGNDWNERAANTEESEIGQTSAVGLFPEGISLTGAYDCAGNVWEWCQDWYDEQQNRKVVKGGAWNYSKNEARCWSRSGDLPDGSLNNVGFRVFLEIEEIEHR